ncbi:TonB-dependent receptor [Marinihelvus fidelis]|uniref:TonB-dependent receptor n=1 Tax=Marinihelvus fidelis TaxID=2613842 RepID=A0A5N0T7D9_9GAMM|nr:TonB-dependent receptor [Marinihelvus fidelis]KAA9130903.1 TonB-dependent receptor [Marinihelvus fidelis]
MSKKMRNTSTLNEEDTELTRRSPLRRGALFAAIAGALAAGPAFAQVSNSGATSDDENIDTQEFEENEQSESDSIMEEVIVSGMRTNLETAQALKRNADTVIETITAEDLGSFPDKSVAEALQRVAGITVNRFAASSDTAHFSAEPSGVIVRGLDMVRTEFNGRDSFSANSSRGLSWGDVSPELMAGVDTYKNQMAELIEGGISGTVNMRTRLPFDQEDQTFALSAGVNYGDLSEDFTPEISGLYSNRWVLSGGSEFGIMANAAYSEVHTRSEGIQLYRMNRFRNVYDGVDLAYIPANIAMRDNLYERERTGISLAAQWASADDTVSTSVQYNSSDYNNAWEEYVVTSAPADLSYGQSVFYEVEGQTPCANNDTTVPCPAPGTPAFTFDENGLFQTGVMTTGVGWWGNDATEASGFAQNAAGMPFVNPCYGWNGCAPTERGVDLSTATRSNNNENKTQDFGWNLKWAVTDTIRTNFDVQYIDSTVQNYDIEVAFNSFTNAYWDLTGARPVVEMQPPTNVNLSDGGYSNPNNWYFKHIMDHVEDSDGNELALRGDIEIDLDSGWMESVKMGVRYADRDQTVRWSGYNWQNVANTWTGGGQNAYFNIDQHNPDNSGNTGFNGYPTGYYVNRAFNSDFFGGGLLSPLDYVFANMDLLQDQQGFANQFGAAALGLAGGVGWDPICSNVGDRVGETPGTCYLPAEISEVSETTNAAYVQLNFGGDDAEIFGIPFSGNVGVRYVETNNKSSGGIAYPLMDETLFFERIYADDGSYVDNPLPRAYENLGCYANGVRDDGTPPAVPFTTGCYISEDDYAYMNGANALSTVDVDHDHFLPSFNIKFDLTDEVLLRFAWSQAMSRPDIGNMKNYLGFGGTLPSQDDANDPLWVKDTNGDIVGANVDYSGGAQNPYLEPIIANQWDISLEYYFADVGSLTAAIFHKKFDDYIQFGSFYRDLTNNGVTKQVEVRGPLNGDGAELQGFELSFQRFFDFLPAPFDGLGVQANYTYIDNKGISNTNTSEVGDGTTITGQAPDAIQVDALEGLSENSYTFIGMYEKGPISVRAAYSWRSEYMVTAVDCCVAYPIWNDDYGQLDASIRWQISDSWELGLSGSNLLNTETKLFQQVTDADDGGLLLPNAWFQNDVRYTLYLRFFSR